MEPIFLFHISCRDAPILNISTIYRQNVSIFSSLVLLKSYIYLLSTNVIFKKQRKKKRIYSLLASFKKDFWQEKKTYLLRQTSYNQLSKSWLRISTRFNSNIFSINRAATFITRQNLRAQEHKRASSASKECSLNFFLSFCNLSLLSKI